MKRYIGLAVIVMTAAAGTYVTANKMRPRSVSSGFVVYQVVRSNGEVIRRITRSHKANGEWKEVSTDPKTGAETVQFGTKDSGVVRVDYEKKENQFVGGWGAPLAADAIRHDPNFMDESELLGYSVMRVHLESASDGSKTDLYRAPELQGMILKVISRDPDGSEFTVEPEKIEMTNPVFATPDYPATRDQFNLHHAKN